MAGTRWGQVWALCRRGFIDVAIPHVVAMEAARQMAEHVTSQEKKVLSQLKDLEGHLGRLGEMGVYRSTARSRDGATSPLARHEIESPMLQRVAAMGGHVLPIPQSSHELVVGRDLDRRKPFHAPGKGYRDTLAWLSVIERLSRCPPGQRVIFVTDNSDDYLESSSLAPSLLAEVPAHVRESGIVVLSTVEALLQSPEIAELLRVHAASNDDVPEEYDWSAVIAPSSGTATDSGTGQSSEARAALGYAAAALTGRPVNRPRQTVADGLDFANVPGDEELWDITIVEVQPDLATGTWRVYDAYAEGTSLVEAEVEADLTLTATTEADYYYYYASAALARVGEPDKRTVLVEYHQRVTLHFKATADRARSVVLSLEFDHASDLAAN